MWTALATDNLNAAKLLLDHKYFRSAASRAYYAAYSALTGVFERQRVSFTFGGSNPSHDQLLALTANNLDPKKFGITMRRQLKRATRQLQMTRLNADYNPRTTVDEAIARTMVRHAALVVNAAMENAR
ncbi:MAG: HEPN domain-containing protein [Phycisphaeraceae bacterium]|nr:HEPN domain-containing protein [Phycisphaeraceae bacterium]